MSGELWAEASIVVAPVMTPRLGSVRPNLTRFIETFLLSNP